MKRRKYSTYLSLGLAFSIIGFIINAISLIIPLLLFLGIFITFFGLIPISRYLGIYYRRSANAAGIILAVVYVLITAGLVFLSITKLISQMNGAEIISGSIKSINVVEGGSNIAFATIGSVMFVMTCLINARTDYLAVTILRAFVMSIFAVFVVSVIVSAITASLVSSASLVALPLITVMYIEFVRG